MMKRILAACIVVVAIVSMTACKKDYEELIVGKWLIESDDGFTAETNFNRYIPDPIAHMDSWGFVFRSDGSGYSYETVNGSDIERSQVTYTIEGNDIHIIYANGVRIRWTVEKINKRKLGLSERYEITTSDGGVRYGYGYWCFERMEYTEYVAPTNPVVPPVDTVAEEDTVTSKIL